VVEEIWRVVAADPHPTPLPEGEGTVRRQ
jgi:hypothetical protein